MGKCYTYFCAVPNGLFRWSRRITASDAQILVYPAYNRGDWGYGSKLKLRGQILTLPFIPASIVGTKHDALREAVKIRDWLQKNSTVGEVTLAKWGDIEHIQPRVDYTR